MRIVVSCLAAALAVAACGKKDETATASPPAADASASAAASVLTLGPDRLPRFRPGLWEVARIEDGKTQMSHECIGEEAGAELKEMLTAQPPGCKTDRSASPAGINIHSTCEQSGIRTESTFAMTGSPTSYNGRASIKVAAQGQTQSTEVLVKAKWTGACPAGVKPGESVEQPS
jgi:hypothetical protein